MASFGFFGVIVKDVEAVAVKTWHVIELIGKDADVLFLDTIKAAELLGIDKAHLLTGVERAKVAVEQYTAEKFPTLEATAIAQLQHEFVSMSLVQKFGLQKHASDLVTTIVSKLFASGSSKLQGLIDTAVKAAESQAGLTQ